MNSNKDLKRFQPDPVFLFRLEQNLKTVHRKSRKVSYVSILTLAASFTVFIWIFPSKKEEKLMVIDQNQTMVYLQEHFEPTEENLELLSTSTDMNGETIYQEEELIDELKMMY